MRSSAITQALGAAGVVLFAACGSSTSPYGGGGGGGGGCTPTATKVCMGAVSFSPPNLTITAGMLVTWQNGTASTTHTVTSSSSSTETFNSGNVAGAGTYTHTFPTAGTYNYYCTIHGVDGTPPTGMHGTITVQP